MPRTIFKTKEDWSINTLGFLVGIVLMYTVPPIFSHFLVKNGIIIEAVVTENTSMGVTKRSIMLTKLTRRNTMAKLF